MNSSSGSREGGPAKRRISGLLGNLARDKAGNTLAMMAAFAIPLALLAGSAVDMSRMYLVKTRLQQACDAGVLAGRKVMTVSSGTTLDPSSSTTKPAETAATSFFQNNFPTGWMSTTGRTFSAVRTSDGQVNGTASVSTPMAIMGMFGFGAITQTVVCTARLDIGDSDIMFVLDVTGSMGCSSGSGCSSTATYTRADGTLGYQIVEQSNSKISALRSAVKLFRTTLETSKPAAAHIRYGFVPYSSSVNVGKLIYDKSPDYIVDSAVYPGRELANDTASNSSTLPTATNTFNYDVTTASTPGKVYEGDVIYGANTTPTATVVALPNTDPYGVSAANTKAGCLQQEVRLSGTTKYAKGTYPPNGANQLGTGTLTRRFPVWTPAAGSTPANCKTYAWTVKPYWRYTNATYDVTGYKASILSSNPAVIDLTKRNGTTHRWQGCIEERESTLSTTSTTFTTGSLPKDLDPDFVPDSTATKWRPLLPNMIFYRTVGTASQIYINGTGASNTTSEFTGTASNGGEAYTNLLVTPANATTASLGPLKQFYGCSAPAKRLAEMTATDFDNYLGTSTSGDFRPYGHTYHDVGMIWGLRLISPQGMWASDTTAWPGNNPPNRYIVFMTDGLMDPDPDAYHLYGLNRLDGRAAATNTSDSNLGTIHNNRFQAVCNAAKAKNITVFVVAFDVGSTVPSNLESCATPGYAYAATDTTTLENAFKTIALQIARLRLSK